MNPQLKFLRLDYWGGHLVYEDGGPNGVYVPCLLLNITDTLFVSLGGNEQTALDSIRIYFRDGYPNGLTQYVQISLVGPQVGTEVVQWMQEQISNAFESDSGVYYPPTQPPILLNGDTLYINVTQ